MFPISGSSPNLEQAVTRISSRARPFQRRIFVAVHPFRIDEVLEAISEGPSRLNDSTSHRCSVYSKGNSGEIPDRSQHLWNDSSAIGFLLRHPGRIVSVCRAVVDPTGDNEWSKVDETRSQVWSAKRRSPSAWIVLRYSRDPVHIHQQPREDVFESDHGDEGDRCEDHRPNSEDEYHRIHTAAPWKQQIQATSVIFHAAIRLQCTSLELDW